jgi:hypothetical protein
MRPDVVSSLFPSSAMPDSIELPPGKPEAPYGHTLAGTMAFSLKALPKKKAISLLPSPAEVADEIEGVHGLLKVIRDTQFEGGGADPLRAVPCQHDHREARTKRPQLGQYLEPGTVRKPMVQQDEVERLTAYRRKGVCARRCRPDFVRPAQEKAQNFLKGRIIGYR